jgi:uncharacterized protein (DUF1330 family)
MENQTFLVVEATPNPENMEDLQKYQSQAPAITIKYGGVPVAKYNVEAAIDSGAKPAVFAVFSFPDQKAIQDLLVNDPDYQQLVPSRDKGFKSIRFFVCDEPSQQVK